MSMLSSQTSQRVLYASAGLSAFAVYKHTSLAFSELFPRLDRAVGIEPPMLFSTKSNFLQVGAAWTIVGKTSPSSRAESPHKLKCILEV
ncbi:hypothetical protein BKA61DRAFT_607456 [Leptodontidium sp. MPI-SDFR-AT-0119]|nr:hypothetical protein BKA61DRAFT_607456 [Leptodontidium sp. MPI-SDFR-AT-0119]